MKMRYGGSAEINEYHSYLRNCNLGTCGRKYYAPIPAFSDLQLYVNFGTVKPATLEFTIFDRCSLQSTTIASACNLIAHNGEQWYGVFTQFTPTITYKQFVVALRVNYEDESYRTFFSEEYSLDEDCANLTKVQVCYPDNYNANDINGIYVGAINEDETFSGNADIRYQHTYWVRSGEVIEMSNKFTFVSNAKKNFATTLDKEFEFRTELVPGWYKDYLMAVYFRGNILLNGTATRVSEFSGENVLEEADLWKPYAKLAVQKKGAFGCAPIDCTPVDCTPPPCVEIGFEMFTLPHATVGLPYSHSIPITGSPVFVISALIKPSWATVAVVGGNLVITGTPLEADPSSIVSFTLSNDCSTVDAAAELPAEAPADHMNIELYSAVGDETGITGVCTSAFDVMRTGDAQASAALAGERVKATIHIEMDNGCTMDYDVIFETVDTTVTTPPLDLNCNATFCSTIDVIEVTNLEIVP